jgi:hypothetical protein
MTSADGTPIGVLSRGHGPSIVLTALGARHLGGAPRSAYTALAWLMMRGQDGGEPRAPDVVAGLVRAFRTPAGATR